MPSDERLQLIVLAIAAVGLVLTLVLMFIGVAGWRHWSVLSTLPGANESRRAWARRVLPTVLLMFVMIGCVFGLCVSIVGELGDKNIPVQGRWILGACSVGLGVFVGLVYGRAFIMMERRKP